MLSKMKDKIKAWLKSYQRDRYWLGDQLDVDKKTVDNWLSSPKEIPLSKLKLIERLMADDEAAEAQRRQQLQPTAQVFSVEVDLITFRSYSRVALAELLTLEDWVIHALNQAAATHFNGPTLSPILPMTLSEDSPTYGEKKGE